MSDESQGPGWWLASDRKWYPPHLHPSVTPTVEQRAAVGTVARPRLGSAALTEVPETLPADEEPVALDRPDAPDRAPDPTTIVLDDEPDTALDETPHTLHDQPDTALDETPHTLHDQPDTALDETPHTLDDQPDTLFEDEDAGPLAPADREEAPTNGYRPRHLAATPVEDLFAPGVPATDRDQDLFAPGIPADLDVDLDEPAALDLDRDLDEPAALDLDRDLDEPAALDRDLDEPAALDLDLDPESSEDAAGRPGPATRTEGEGSGRRAWLILAGIVALAAAGAVAAFALLGGSDDEPDPPTTSPTAVPSTGAAVTTPDAPLGTDPAPEDPPTTDSVAPTPETDPPPASDPPATAAPTTTTTLDDGTTSVFALSPGTCIDAPDLGNGPVSELPEVACDLPHSHEVYAVLQIESADGVFDQGAVAEFAATACRDTLLDYARDELEPALQYLSLEPTQESWDREGDREVVCILFNPDEPLTGSAAA